MEVSPYSHTRLQLFSLIELKLTLPRPPTPFLRRQSHHLDSRRHNIYHCEYIIRKGETPCTHVCTPSLNIQIRKLNTNPYPTPNPNTPKHKLGNDNEYQNSMRIPFRS